MMLPPSGSGKQFLRGGSGDPFRCGERRGSDPILPHSERSDIRSEASDALSSVDLLRDMKLTK